MRERAHDTEPTSGQVGNSLIVPAQPHQTASALPNAPAESNTLLGLEHPGNIAPVSAENVSAVADRTSARLKRLITWSVWLGSTAIAFIFIVVVLLTITHQRWRVDQSWLVAMVQEHFPAVVGLPFAALASFAIVTVLESTSGPLEFEGLTFKFKGAAGPAVLWIACFISISVAVRALW